MWWAAVPLHDSLQCSHESLAWMVSLHPERQQDILLDTNTSQNQQKYQFRIFWSKSRCSCSITVQGKAHSHCFMSKHNGRIRVHVDPHQRCSVITLPARALSQFRRLGERWDLWRRIPSPWCWDWGYPWSALWCDRGWIHFPWRCLWGEGRRRDAATLCEPTWCEVLCVFEVEALHKGIEKALQNRSAIPKHTILPLMFSERQRQNHAHTVGWKISRNKITQRGHTKTAFNPKSYPIPKDQIQQRWVFPTYEWEKCNVFKKNHFTFDQPHQQTRIHSCNYEDIYTHIRSGTLHVQRTFVLNLFETSSNIFQFGLRGRQHNSFFTTNWILWIHRGKREAGEGIGREKQLHLPMCGKYENRWDRKPVVHQKQKLSRVRVRTSSLEKSNISTSTGALSSRGCCLSSDKQSNNPYLKIHLDNKRCLVFQSSVHTCKLNPCINGTAHLKFLLHR